MKNVIYIVCLFLIIACDSESAVDCFQKSGPIIRKEITVGTFNKILVNRDIELIVEEGLEQKIIIETGKNLMNDVTATVIDERLTLTDQNTCNYVRDYGITKVYITSPNITEIRSSTQYTVSSKGVLTYPSLRILSEDFSLPNSFISGDFNLKINNNSFSLVFNGISNCFISGQTNNMDITFAAGTSRFEGRDLIAQNVTIWNRSSNDMIVNPQQSITGKILGTGNVIAVNQPPQVNVEELYKGRLIFE
ncbi:head GIN domain-containing protein [Litoribaculum gwangyangense]|uniref:Putative auto-transporter adhesin head GIN domain-containing protein n=1 Tax=Litoribaculum gwangyangense TaxID=1130722 RepID=A0ABP9BR37_9FLAO